MKHIIKNTDYLVIEANYDPQMLQNGPYPRYLQDRIRCGTGHLSNSQCGATLVENYTERLKHIWLCHLSEENNHPELAVGCVALRVVYVNILLRNVGSLEAHPLFRFGRTRIESLLVAQVEVVLRESNDTLFYGFLLAVRARSRKQNACEKTRESRPFVRMNPFARIHYLFAVF